MNTILKVNILYSCNHLQFLTVTPKNRQKQIIKKKRKIWYKTMQVANNTTVENTCVENRVTL